MARSVIAFVAAALVLASCGKDDDKPKPVAPTNPPPNTAPTPGGPSGGGTGGSTATPPTNSLSWTGTLQLAGVSIHMEGSHKLVEGGKTVVLLKSTNPFAELKKFEGKRVNVTGMPSPTVEGGQTIVDVQTIVEAP